MSKELTKKLFEDVVVFFFSVPGAMGLHNMSFYKKSGESFSVDYLSNETPYGLLKELFPVLQDCYWDGPMRGEKEAEGTFVFGRENDGRETHVAAGWKHMYLNYGNHLAIREELYDEVVHLFKGIGMSVITFDWIDILERAGFHKRIDEIKKLQIKV